MNERALWALVRLEVRRAWPVLRPTLPLGAGFLALMWLFKWLTPENEALVLMVIGMSGIWSAPTSAMRDKIDGGMEFLTALPLERKTLAAARMIASILFGLFAGLFGAAAVLVVFGSRMAGVGAIRLTVASFGMVSLVSAVAAALATALACRMEARSFSWLFLVGLGGIASVGAIEKRLPASWKHAALTALGRPWLPEAVALAVFLVSVLLLFLAYHVARTGFERFTPGRDRITW